jgi:hypothetical protein
MAATTPHRPTAALVNQRIDREILPALAELAHQVEENTRQVAELQATVAAQNGPTTEALLGLVRIAPILGELAAERARQDKVAAAREVLEQAERERRDQASARRWARRVAKALLWSAPFVALLWEALQIVGVLPAIWRVIHH